MKRRNDILTDIAIVVALFAVIGLGLGGYYTDRQQKQIDKFDIKVRMSDTLGFVTRDKVLGMLDDSLGGVGSVAETDVRRIEKFLDAVVYVSDAEVYKDESGELHVMIGQRIPAVRVLDDKGRSFYLAQDGTVMPRCGDFVADVPLITMSDSLLSVYYFVEDDGKIISKNYNFTDNLINFALRLESDSFWRDFITQINLNKEGEVELIPRIGSHKVIMCDVSELNRYEVFLSKLNKFYFKELKRSGWNRYRIINLKFDNMIVCSK